MNLTFRLFLFIILPLVTLVSYELKESTWEPEKLTDQEIDELVKEFTGPSYKKDILPIFQKNCSMCHNGNTPDRNWLVYQVAYNSREKIKMRLENGSMPIGIKMLDEDRKKVIEWVNKGAKK